jgi:hypothetical protein
MKFVANIQLLSTNEQAVALCDMVERCNAAGAWRSERAWATQMFQQFNLHTLYYVALRERCGLSAQTEKNCRKDAQRRRNLPRTTDVLTMPMRSAYESPTYHAGSLHGLYAV